MHTQAEDLRNVLNIVVFNFGLHTNGWQVGTLLTRPTEFTIVMSPAELDKIRELGGHPVSQNTILHSGFLLVA